MILRSHPGGVLVIGQPAHAWLSGRLARAWGNQLFEAPEPYEAVCLAAEQHDIGMAGWDSAPQLDPRTGLPYSFSSMPRSEHVRLWSSAARLMLPQGRYPALLVSRHGTGLYERHVPERELRASPVREYLAGERAFQRDLIASLGVAPDEVERNSDLIRIWDSMSLFACLAGESQTTIDGAQTRDGPASLELRRLSEDHTRFAVSPWPLGPRSLTAPVEGRLLTGRFDDRDRMLAALDRAAWATLPITFVPA
ncbi:MAG: DUF3891 family protein [Gaiellales bacterium]